MLGYSFFIVMLLFLLLMRKYSPAIKGTLGEKKISITLSKLQLPNSTIYHDLYIPTSSGKTSQIDHLVLTPKGIFVIETRNYSGWIFGSETSYNWTQVIYKRKQKFYNPIKQNEGHIKALMHYLGEKSLSNVPIHSVIVFNDEVTLKFKEPFQHAIVTTRKHLLSEIRNVKSYSYLPLGQLQSIQKKISRINLTDKKQKAQIAKTHIRQVKSQLSQKKKQSK